HYAQDKLKKPAKDVRAGIIYEDGPYGAGVAAANEAEAKKQGMQVVLKEGYSIQAPDLSSLVTKLRSQRPDVLFHTGYNPDIALFLRPARSRRTCRWASTTCGSCSTTCCRALSANTAASVPRRSRRRRARPTSPRAAPCRATA